ncbi:MAG: hypothetical protein RLZZ74_1333 [Cyanobacteriota bacterium]|jgi:hypothetical protein
MTTEKTLVLPASKDQSQVIEFKIKGSLLLIGAIAILEKRNASLKL